MGSRARATVTTASSQDGALFPLNFTLRRLPNGKAEVHTSPLILPADVPLAEGEANKRRLVRSPSPHTISLHDRCVRAHTP